MTKYNFFEMKRITYIRKPLIKIANSFIYNRSDNL